MTREQFLKNKIIDSGFRLKEFAQKIDMPYSTLLSIINNSVGGASLDNINKICNGLNINIESLNPKKEGALILDIQEVSLVKDYRSLTPAGQDYIRQTMDMAKKTYSDSEEDIGETDYIYGKSAAYGGGIEETTKYSAKDLYEITALAEKILADQKKEREKEEKEIEED